MGSPRTEVLALCILRPDEITTRPPACVATSRESLQGKAAEFDDVVKTGTTYDERVPVL